MLFYFACEAAGASSAPHSLRPHLVLGRKIHASLGRYPRRENAIGCLKIESKIHRCRPGQAKRDPGPIATALSCCAKVIEQRLSNDRRGVWVPAFAGTTPVSLPATNAKRLRTGVKRRSNPS